MTRIAFLWLKFWVWVEDMSVSRERRRRQRRCVHRFRPVKWDGKPGRYCPKCERLDNLTVSEFYAEFGERGWQWVMR